MFSSKYPNNNSINFSKCNRCIRCNSSINNNNKPNNSSTLNNSSNNSNTKAVKVNRILF